MDSLLRDFHCRIHVKHRICSSARLLYISQQYPKSRVVEPICAILLSTEPKPTMDGLEHQPSVRTAYAVICYVGLALWPLSIFCPKPYHGSSSLSNAGLLIRRSLNDEYDCS